MSSKAKQSFDRLLGDLNEAQRQAVTQLDGPVLILAGAGSGKTRVLTYRIAYLIAGGKATARDIIALTFTNKAAGEMRERVHKLVPESVATMWVGTFHSLFARILRREADRIGFSPNFTIYDADDQEALIKTILNENGVSLQVHSPKLIAYTISRAKNAMISPEELQREADNPLKQVAATVYHEYMRHLRRLNAMDFDDLLVKPIELFALYPLVKEYYQDRFRYIMVDEYQDTNRAQYLVLRELADKFKNICVVGDDDQSIYRWRGAEVRNILEFERDYPACAKYRLEQNYRSTPAILGLAHSVVTKNRERHEKKLWTEKKNGELVSLVSVYDQREEARLIVEKISAEFRKGERKFGDFAVLYRINAQSRSLEDGFRIEGIPYIIVGGIRFYERKEIKDVLAYLRLLVNPADTISLKRIINYPARGIGEATIAKIDAYAREQKLSFLATLDHVEKMSGLQKRTAERLILFARLIRKYQALQNQVSAAELASTLVEELGILRQFKEENTIDSATRAENVRELLQAIHEFSAAGGEENTLAAYLQQVSLITDLDTWDDRANAVTLMTLHAAKGLEFPVVFIAGLEEGLFPLSRNIDDPRDLEEERRLFYVGSTRAKDKLYLFWAKNRQRFGESRSYKSRFLKEVDMNFVTTEESPTIARERRGQSQISYSYDAMPHYEEESQETVEFNVGMRVRHQTFGKGTILSVEPSSGGAKLVVNFDRVGKKRLVLPFAQLEIL
ncbi:UvrD-helicase domain-containing protein [candidate division KSB1 bacterium]|nr:UvrD-helicase domain-containing protein [candidate division KSB1 bacterium]